VPDIICILRGYASYYFFYYLFIFQFQSEIDSGCFRNNNRFVSPDKDNMPVPEDKKDQIKTPP